MPRNSLGIPIVASSVGGAIINVNDVLWESFGSNEIAINYAENYTNIVLHSQDITDAEAWSKTNVAADSTLYEAPDNSTTANAIKSNSTGEKSYNMTQSNLSVTAGKTYTASVHLKKDALGFAKLRFNDGTINYSAVFNLTTGASSNTGNLIGTPNKTSVDTMDDGWFRCSMTFQAQNTTSSGVLRISPQADASTSNPNIAVSGIVLIYVWGFQLEENIEASPYIVTTTEARTATETLNDLSSVWDFDSADLMPQETPNSEGVWETSDNLVLNHDYADMGSELITNGDYSNGLTGWAKSTSANSNNSSLSVNTSNQLVISSGAGGVTSYGIAVQELATPLVAGKVYKVKIDILSVTGGEGASKIRVGTTSSTSASAGVTNIINNDSSFLGAGNVIYFTPTSNDSHIAIGARDDITEMIVDNVSVQQVDPNDRWSLGTNVSISDGKLNWANSPNNNGGTQSSSLTQGTAYEVTFTVSDYSSGSVRIRFPFVGTRRTANGTYTQIGVANQDTSDIFIQGEESGGNTATLSVDNVTVREYAIQPQDV